MITQAGHIALIVPQYARPPVRRLEVGVYRYLGASRWETIEPKDRNIFFHVGI
jgi:hypothetical protein